MEKQPVSNEEEKFLALIQAGYGKEVRPNAAQREIMIRKMKSEVKSFKTRSEFPPAVLIAIPLILLCAAGWVLTENGSGAGIIRSIFIAGLGLNLICIPISSMLIIYRRRYDSKK